LINDDDITLPPGPAWQAARKACQMPLDRKRLAAATKAGWRPEEFSEFARSCHRRRGKDYATLHSYRSALTHHNSKDGQLWRKLFRARGSLRLPPRCSKELDYTPPASGIGSNHRYWPFHSPELIALIDARARAYFKISDSVSLHPHAWIASYLWYQKEQADAAKDSQEALELS
jgi:hypothetical protein